MPQETPTKKQRTSKHSANAATWLSNTSFPAKRETIHDPPRIDLPHHAQRLTDATRNRAAQVPLARARMEASRFGCDYGRAVSRKVSDHSFTQTRTLAKPRENSISMSRKGAAHSAGRTISIRSSGRLGLTDRESGRCVRSAGGESLKGEFLNISSCCERMTTFERKKIVIKHLETCEHRQLVSE